MKIFDVKKSFDAIYSELRHPPFLIIPPILSLSETLQQQNEKSIAKFRERVTNGKQAFPKFGNGKGMKKYIPKVRERESEASILGNDREREREWE